MKKLICTFLGLGLLTACVEDAPKNPDPIAPGINRVWIVNEGNFNAGNSTLGIYDLDSNTYSASVFAATNNRPLGDVFQSAIQIENEMYLVVNNSGKIEVVNKENFESTGTIPGLVSPRYALEVTPTEVYVSDLFSDSVAVVNPATKKITGHIDLSATSEEMVIANGKVFIANPYSNQISVVNITSKKVTTIATTFNPTAVGVDKNGKVWVLCGGDPSSSVNGAVEVIDAQSESVDRTIPLKSGSYTNRLAFNQDRDSLYLLTGDVNKISIAATDIPATPFIDGSAKSFYGIGYLKTKNEVWVADSKLFSQKGEVLIYRSNGELKTSFTAGVGTSGFLFE